MKLFSHQHTGAAFLSNSPGTKGLFFGMGTGKTITALHATALLWDRTEPCRALVIAPPIALPMWQAEANAYLHVDSQILKTGKTPIQSGVLIVSYAIAAKRAAELRDWLAADSGVLICDESHALKSVKAQRTKAILGKGGVVEGAGYSWMLTGTPITRWNDDMFPFLVRADTAGMVKKCGKGRDMLERFQLQYTVRQKRQFSGARWPVQMVVGNTNTDKLAEWVYSNDGKPLALRVDLKEVFENMPPMTHRRYDVPIEADAVLKSKLKAMEKMTIEQIRKQADTKEPALATLRRELGLAKVKAAAAEIAERIESGQNVLVGAWHTEVIDELVKALEAKGYTTGIIDGRGSSQQKKVVQDMWNEGRLQAVVAQIAAAGVSLNLQHGGTQIIVVEEDWSPSIMDQFYARLWRYGQEKHVHVDTLTADTKLDKAVGKISSTKKREHHKFNSLGREAANG